MSGVISQPNVIRIAAFLTYYSMAVWMTYFYLYLGNSVGLDGFSIGLIAAIQQFATVFFMPAWGVIADKFGRKYVYVIVLIIAALLVPGFGLGGPLHFYMVMTLVVTLFPCSFSGLMDSILIDYTKQFPQYSYGNFRIWSSIGWAASCLFTAWLLVDMDMNRLFPIASLFMVLNALLLLFFYKPIKVKSLEIITPKKVIKAISSNRFFMVFLLFIFLLGTASPPVFLFINIYLDDIGATPSVVGVVFAIQAISEIPFFFWGGWFIRKFGSGRVFLFCIFFTSIRFLIMSFIDDPVYAMVLGISQGVTFGLFFYAVTEIVQSIIPPDLRATGQSLIYACYFGAGIGVGSFVMGAFKEGLGMQHIMLIDAAWVLVIFTAALIYFFVNKRMVQ